MKTMEPINISELLKPYTGKWVALNGDETRVICSGESVQDVIAEAKKHGETNPIIVKAPDQYTAFLL